MYVIGAQVVKSEGEFIYPSYVQDIMGCIKCTVYVIMALNVLFCSDIFSMGFGPFR